MTDGEDGLDEERVILFKSDLVALGETDGHLLRFVLLRSRQCDLSKLESSGCTTSVYILA